MVVPVAHCPLFWTECQSCKNTQKPRFENTSIRIQFKSIHGHNLILTNNISTIHK